MATIKQPKSEEQVAHMNVTALRREYNELAKVVNKIIDRSLVYCHAEDEFLRSDLFYSDKRFKSGLFPISKGAILNMATDIDKITGERKDNKEKTKTVLQLMDLPYIDTVYRDAMKSVIEAIGEKNRGTAFQQMIVMLKSLPQYKKLTWRNSEFGSEEEQELDISKEVRPEIKKIFGSGFSESDYLYLQDQYDDWKARTQVDTKSQETYIVQICFKQLEIWKAQKAGNDTDKMIKSLNDLMASANLQPRQNINNAATDALSFGQLLERWEEEQPIPDPDPEFADVNNIGKYIRVWFQGGLAHALGLKNAYTDEYDEEIESYTVKRPEEIDGDETSSVYADIFGTSK